MRKVHPSEVEYVLWGDEYLDVETVLDRISENIAYGIVAPEDLSEDLYVADKVPLRVKAKDSVVDYTYEWDEYFEEYCYPPEWDGREEFQAAIDTFVEAAKKFEEANSRYYGLTCSHRKKVDIYELVKHWQCMGDVK